MALFVFALAPAACAGPEARSKKSVAEFMSDGAPAAAARLIESRRDEYGDSNSVLYNLDLGLALHDAGAYRDSSRHFDAAERRLEELYTKSVSAAGGRFLANENIQDFRGRPLDRVLCQFFDALNFALLGETDEALVPVRRMEAFLDESDRAEPGRRIDAASGPAHYLAALLYSDSGRPDDARISFEAAQRAYAGDRLLSGAAPPDLEAPAVPGGMGELVLLHYNGPAPRKIAVSAAARDESVAREKPAAPAQNAAPSGRIIDGVRGAVNQTGQAARRAVEAAVGTTQAVVGAVLKTSYPKYVQDEYRIAGSEVESLPTTRFPTVLLIDIFSMVSRDLEAEAALLKARSTMRAVLKLAQQAATGIGAADSEFADVRSWSTLPAQIRVARRALTPGSYRLRVVRLDAAGRSLSERIFENVSIRSGRRTWLMDQTAL